MAIPTTFLNHGNCQELLRLNLKLRNVLGQTSSAMGVILLNLVGGKTFLASILHRIKGVEHFGYFNSVCGGFLFTGGDLLKF